MAGLLVDLQLADMAAVRVIRGGGGVDRLLDQARLHPLGDFLRIEGDLGDLLDRQAAVAARR